MVSRQNMLAVWNSVFRSVPKDQSFAAGNLSGPQQMRQVTIEADLSQADDDPQLAEQSNFLI